MLLSCREPYTTTVPPSFLAASIRFAVCAETCTGMKYANKNPARNHRHRIFITILLAGECNTAQFVRVSFCFKMAQSRTSRASRKEWDQRELSRHRRIRFDDARRRRSEWRHSRWSRLCFGECDRRRRRIQGIEGTLPGRDGDRVIPFLGHAGVCERASAWQGRDELPTRRLR